LGLNHLIAFLAQVDGGGGFGVLSIGVSGVISIYIAFLAWQKTRANCDFHFSSRVCCLCRFGIGRMGAINFNNR
jgi:hypothetical protein